MTDATPTQPTGSGKWIWCMPLLRDVVDCAQFAAPDPRDARIAQLEAALSAIQSIAVDQRVPQIFVIASVALMPSPEGDMAITQEVMDA